MLDFFAGSGTTAQAVLELNHEDEENEPRRFILVSSTEAPPNNPDNKNLCRDVCAVRVKRVIEGNNNRKATGGDFAYCRLVKISPADVMQDLDAELIWNSLCLKHRRALLPYPANQLNTLYQDADTAIIYCPYLNEEVIADLIELPVSQLIVYSDRPDSLAELIAPFKKIQSLSAFEAVL